MPVDVLEVTAGQDRGARFGLLGSEATIGRGPVMDIVLTDPRISRRHARLLVDGGVLLVEDLGSTGGTRVNGVPIARATALARGDRVALGGTEMTILWTPGTVAQEPPRAREPADPPPPLPPPPDPPPTLALPAPRPAPAPLARPLVLLPAACLALAAFSLAALWMPALGGPGGTRSVWSLGRPGVRAEALAAVLVAAAGAGAWLAAGRVRPPAQWWRVAAVVAAAGGGLIAGIPLLLGAVELGGADREAGLVLLALAGLAVAGCAVAGLAVGTRGRGVGAGRPRPGAMAEPALVAAGGAVGGLVAAIGTPLVWVSSGDVGLTGLDDGVAAGRWVVPLAVAVIGCSTLTLAVARTGGRRAALPLAAGAAALAGALLTFAITAALGYESYRIGPGLSLALAGGAVALAATLMGAISLAVSVKRT